MSYNNNLGKWQVENLVKKHDLTGATIKGIGSNDTGFVFFLVGKPDWDKDKALRIQNDPEGNGAGFIKVSV